jgi:mannonate dehydratase
MGLCTLQSNPDNFRLGGQAGATRVVALFTNHFDGRKSKMHGGDPRKDWIDRPPDTLQTYRELSVLQNVSPRFWCGDLPGGPERPPQIKGLKRLIRDAGRACVCWIGCRIPIGAVNGWTRGPNALGPVRTLTAAAE